MHLFKLVLDTFEKHVSNYFISSGLQRFISGITMVLTILNSEHNIFS